jgi:rhodanese-related sulfurtransferase
MRTWLATASLVCVLLPAAAAAQSADAIDAPRITQSAFKKLIAAHNVIIVDTRVFDAFEQSHIKDALPLPLEGRLTWADEYEKTVALLLKTRKPVVAYCA